MHFFLSFSPATASVALMLSQVDLGKAAPPGRCSSLQTGQISNGLSVKRKWPLSVLNVGYQMAS